VETGAKDRQVGWRAAVGAALGTILLAAACGPTPAATPASGSASGSAAKPASSEAAGSASGVAPSAPGGTAGGGGSTSAGAPAPPAAPLVKVRHGHPTAAVGYLYLFIAQEQGFYRQQGLDVELQQLAPNILLAALSAGEVDYTAGIPGGIRLALRGEPLKVVSLAALQGFTLITPSSISAPTQLRGKPVAITAPGSAGDQAMRRGLAHLGLDPQTDVTAVIMGDPATQWQALEAGAVEAAALTLPYSVLAERAGFRPWVRTESLYRAANTGLVAPQNRLDTRRNEVLGLIRAETAAVRFIKSNRDATTAVMAQRLGLTPEVAAAAYDAALDTFIETNDLEQERDALEAVIAIERAAAPPAVDKGWTDLVDPAPAREAAR
jgi:NitT/TauT family transport system substrate-binding protein